MKAGAKEFVPLSLVAVEHVDVDGTGNAIDMTVGSELPIDKFDVRFVFTVSGNPDVVFLLDVDGMGHMLVDKHLADVKDRTHMGAALHIVHEGADATHELLVTANLTDLCVDRFDIEYGWKVVLADECVVDEVGGLGQR